MVNKSIVKILKSHVAALVLSELIARDNQYAEPDGAFYFSSERLEKELFIGRDARRSAFLTLVQFKILDIEKRGMPNKYYFRINYAILEKLIIEYKDSIPTSEAGTDLTRQGDTRPTSEAGTDLTYRKNKDKERIEKENKTGSDPFIKKIDFEKSNIVHDEIEKFFLKVYSTKPKPDRIYCNEIVHLLQGETEEEVREEIAHKIIQFWFHPWWGIQEKIKPTAKMIFKAWENLSDEYIPEWFKKGYRSQEEYLNDNLMDAVPMDLMDVEPISSEQANKNRMNLFKNLGE